LLDRPPATSDRSRRAGGRRDAWSAAAGRRREVTGSGRWSMAC